MNIHLCVIKSVQKCSVIEDGSDVVGKEGQTGSSNSSFSGTLMISEGASFTEELRNRSSVHFKALALDMQLLVNRFNFITDLILDYDVTKSSNDKSVI